MRKCDDCKIILDDDVRHCPKCGKDLSPSAPAPRPAGSDVTSVLASANLHRIRAEWDDAIDDATDALRLEPRNPDISSLLGSIYEERGMFDEALVWYQMTLELNPDSAPDQGRLDRVSELVSARRIQGGTGSFHVFEKRTKIWAWVLGAVFVVIVAMALISTLLKGKPNEAPYTRPTHTPRSQEYTPQVNAPSQTLPHGPKTGSEVSTPAASSVRTPGESYILSELSTSQGVMQTGASIDDVIADPRSWIVSVTFTVPFKGFVTREHIIAAAVAVARKTFDLNRNVKFVTVRCVIQVGGAQGTQIGFVGDIARQTVDALPPTATGDQLTSAFTRPWWNPQINGAGSKQ